MDLILRFAVVEDIQGLFQIKAPKHIFSDKRRELSFVYVCLRTQWLRLILDYSFLTQEITSNKNQY